MVEIPMDLNAAIVEDVSEEDYNSEEEETKQAQFEEEFAAKQKNLTVQAVVNDLIE